MKTFSFIFLLSLSFAYSQNENYQEVSSPQFRLSLGYGYAAMNPKELNEHIANSNTQMNSTAKSIKSMPELSGTLTFSPNESGAIITLRGGYLWIERNYSFQISETNTTGTEIGKINGNLTETYSAYPFAIGVGLTNDKSTVQLQIEFIYALGYIAEEGAYTQSSGQRTSFMHSYFSPTYGFRAAVGINAPITKQIGLGFELGYRYMTFDEFENEMTAQASPLEFPMNGIQGGVRLNLNL